MLMKFVHDLTFALLRVVDMVMNAFYFLAGLTKTDGTPLDFREGGGVSQDLLSQIFFKPIDNNNYNITMTNIYIQFAGIAVAILAICFVVALLKSFFGKEDEIKTKKLVYAKTGQSFVWMICMPVLFILFLWFLSAFFVTITGIMSASMGGSDLSIGHTIMETCIKDTTNLDNLNDLKLTMSYYDLNGLIGKSNFNYLLCLIAGGCSLFGIFTVTLTLVERIIYIFFYYIISPFVFAKLPLDQGKTFQQWKEVMMVKLFSLIGIVVCAFLFFIIYNVMEKMEFFNEHLIVKLMFLIGGIFTFTKAGTAVAGLISSSAGQAEAMSQGTTMGLLSGGMRVAGGVARGAFGASLLSGRGASGMKDALAKKGDKKEGTYSSRKNAMQSIKEAGAGIRATAGDATQRAGVMAGVGALGAGVVKQGLKGVGSVAKSGVSKVKNKKKNDPFNLAQKNSKAETIASQKPIQVNKKSLKQDAIAKRANSLNQLGLMKGKVSRKDKKQARKGAKQDYKENLKKYKGEYRKEKQNYNSLKKLYKDGQWTSPVEKVREQKKKSDKPEE